MQTRELHILSQDTRSSTLALILYRYGDARNLTFVLPKGPVHFNWPEPFRLSATTPVCGGEGKIVCSHTRYNKAPVNFLLPKPKSRYITILRHPVSHFESVFAFFRMAKKLELPNDANPIETFLRSNPKDTPERRFQTLGNPSMFDFGFDQKYFENRNVVMKHINYIEEEFDLVLINEHYDESLILFKNLFCWDLEDILYLEHKVRQKRAALSNEMKANILSWSHSDVLLYKHFNATLWRKISEAGPKFFEDLQLFHQKNKPLQAVCLGKRGKGELEIDSEKNVENYSRMCKKMAKGIISYLAYTKKN